MVKIKYLPIFLLFVSSITYGQKKNRTGAKYNYKTKCMGTEMDGSYTLEAWGGTIVTQRSKQRKMQFVMLC